MGLSELWRRFFASGPRKQYRYPALAAANKVLFTLESEVADFASISAAMDSYKRAQSINETRRDLAYIPIYFQLEEFLVSHQPPTVKTVMNVPQIREKVRQNVEIQDLSEPFRLVFLPENEQVDHLLKIGAMEMLRFLLTSLGPVQLNDLVHEMSGQTPLQAIKVTDDGISFEQVHPRMILHSRDEVFGFYQHFYQGLYNEIVSVFGDKTAAEQIESTKQKLAGWYPEGLVSVFLNALGAAGR